MLNTGLSEFSDEEIERLGRLQAGFAEAANADVERMCALGKLRLICMEISARRRRSNLRLIESGEGQGDG
jgi:hypothetical protein